MAREARRRAEGAMKNGVTMASLLYTEEGIEWTMEIWNEFARERRELKRYQDKRDKVEKREETIWGMGELN